MDTSGHVEQDTREEAAAMAAGSSYPSAPSFPQNAPPPPRSWRDKGYYADDPRRKSPVLASLMSALPGLGQVYVGYYQQGFINILVIGGVIALLSQSGRFGISGFEPLFGFFLAFYWLFNIVDAGRRAMLYNHALAGLDPMTVPEAVQLPGVRGSMAAGVVMVVLGAIIATNTLFGLSLQWVERWWPVGLVLGGVYLIWQGRKKS